MTKEAKIQGKRIDQMGKLHNILLENINTASLPLSEVLMILEMIKLEVVQGFQYEIAARVNGGNVG